LDAFKDRVIENIMAAFPESPNPYEVYCDAAGELNEDDKIKFGTEF
jgi:hypothetical protein